MSLRAFPPAIALAALSLVLALPARAGAQLLRRASETVRSSEPSRSRSSSDSDDDRSDRESSLGRASSTVRSGGGGGGGGGGGIALGRGPRHGWWGPQRWYLEPSYAVYAPASAYAGATMDYPDAELRTMVVAQLEGSYVSGEVWRGTAAVRVLLPAPAEVFAGYSAYFEPLETGGVEALALGRLGGAWRAIDEDDVHLRLGGSLRHWQDYAGARFGGEVLAGLEIFPAEPLVLGIEGAAGIVGDAWALELRGTVGVLLGLVELYAGWHHLALEATNGSGGVELTGPLLGLRLWI